MSYGPEIAKAAVSRDRGFAKANRYRVIISPPMRLAQFMGNASPSLDLFAESVTLPGKQINSFDYPFNALENMVKYPNGYMTEDVTVVFRLTNRYNIKALFDQWQRLIVNDNYLLEYAATYEGTIVIEQLNEMNQKVYGAQLNNAYPITVGGIDLSSESANSISKVSVTFTYTKLDTNI